jgi:hydrogenase maturation protease
MAQGGASAHELALPNVLVLARLRGRSPEEVAIVAVEPAQIETGLDLSPQVAAAVEAAAALAKQVLLEWKAL